MVLPHLPHSMVAPGGAVNLQQLLGLVFHVINSELCSIFPSIFTIFPALLQPFLPLLPHLERHLLYLVPGPHCSLLGGITRDSHFSI